MCDLNSWEYSYDLYIFKWVHAQVGFAVDYFELKPTEMSIHLSLLVPDIHSKKLHKAIFNNTSQVPADQVIMAGLQLRSGVSFPAALNSKRSNVQSKSVLSNDPVYASISFALYLYCVQPQSVNYIDE